jgi:hypothetical protein
MNTFKEGQTVRVAEAYAKVEIGQSLGWKSVVGMLGTVKADANPAESEYVKVQLPHTEWSWLFFPEELEAV